jgi:hypothetical protein
MRFQMQLPIYVCSHVAESFQLRYDTKRVQRWQVLKESEKVNSSAERAPDMKPTVSQ